jgi:hypothetical protein
MLKETWRGDLLVDNTGENVGLRTVPKIKI